jgi:hypothetical protein
VARKASAGIGSVPGAPKVHSFGAAGPGCLRIAGPNLMLWPHPYALPRPLSTEPPQTTYTGCASHACRGHGIDLVETSWFYRLRGAIRTQPGSQCHGACPGCHAARDTGSAIDKPRRSPPNANRPSPHLREIAIEILSAEQQPAPVPLRRELSKLHEVVDPAS